MAEGEENEDGEGRPLAEVVQRYMDAVERREMMAVFTDQDREKFQGRKDDMGKPRWDLLPRSIEKLVEVYTIGENKYGGRNWEKGIAWCRIFRAMIGHSFKWFFGEKRDSVDGQHHLASVAWCALALMEYEETHPELDDRPHGEPQEHPGGATRGEPALIIEPPMRPIDEAGMGR